MFAQVLHSSYVISPLFQAPALALGTEYLRLVSDTISRRFGTKFNRITQQNGHTFINSGTHISNGILMQIDVIGHALFGQWTGLFCVKVDFTCQRQCFKYFN